MDKEKAHIHSEIFFSYKNEIKFKRKWIKLEIIMLNKISQDSERQIHFLQCVQSRFKFVCTQMCTYVVMTAKRGWVDLEGRH